MGSNQTSSSAASTPNTSVDSRRRLLCTRARDIVHHKVFSELVSSRLNKKGIVYMLELRPTCEHCNKPLPPHSTEAMICSFECTFCKSCVENILNNVCPNCGGGFAT